LKKIFQTTKNRSNHRVCLQCPNSVPESAVGYINISVRLAQPLDLKKLMEYLRNDEGSDNVPSVQRDISKESQVFHATAHNYLQVILHKVKDVVGGCNENVFVSYQLLGFTETSTNKIECNAGQSINLEHRAMYPLIINRPFLKALREGCCDFTMYHSNQKEATEKDTKVCGTGRIQLVTLAGGLTIESSVEILSTEGVRVARLCVEIRWMHQPKLMEFDAITLENENLDIEILLEYFRNGSDINYINFLRCVDPPYPVLKLLATLKEKEHSSNDKLGDLQSVIGQSKTQHITEEYFVKTVTNFVSLKQEEARELYFYIDNVNEKRLLADYVYFYLFSPEIKKLRAKFLTLTRGPHISAREPFKVVDKGETGCISMDSCIQCLQSIGIIRDGESLNLAWNKIDLH